MHWVKRLPHLGAISFSALAGLGLIGCDEAPSMPRTVFEQSSLVAAERNKNDEQAGVVHKTPLVVEIKPSDELQADLINAITRDPQRSVKLTLSGVVPPQDTKDITGLSVFVNLPPHPTPQQLSPESRYHAGAVAFEPSGGSTKPQGFNLDITEVLVQLLENKEWAPKDPIRLTIFAVPADMSKDLPEDLSIPIRRLTLSVPK